MSSCHPCATEFSLPRILLLRLNCALFMENRRESRLREDSALTHSNTHIHHFSIALVLFHVVIKKAVNFLNSIIV